MPIASDRAQEAAAEKHCQRYALGCSLRQRQRLCQLWLALFTFRAKQSAKHCTKYALRPLLQLSERLWEFTRKQWLPPRATLCRSTFFKKITLSTLLNTPPYLINSNLVWLERCHLVWFNGENRISIALVVLFLEPEMSVRRNRERNREREK